MYLYPDPTLAIAEVPSTTRLTGLIAVSGTAWGLRLGVANANLSLQPDYPIFPGAGAGAGAAAAAAAMQCNYLATLPGDAVVMTDRVLKILANSDACSKTLDVGASCCGGLPPGRVKASDGSWCHAPDNMCAVRDQAKLNCLTTANLGVSPFPAPKIASPFSTPFTSLRKRLWPRRTSAPAKLPSPSRVRFSIPPIWSPSSMPPWMDG